MEEITKISERTQLRLIKYTLVSKRKLFENVDGWVDERYCHTLCS